MVVLQRHPYPAVVGIDPSLTSTGVAVIDPNKPYPRTLTVASKGKADADWGARAARIFSLARSIAHHVPMGSLVIIEAPAYSRSMATSASQHDRAGLWWELYRLLDDEQDARIIAVPPTVRAKYATGKGNASKDAVLAAAVRRYTNTDIGGNDMADAMVLAALGARLIGAPVDEVPKLNLTALATVKYDGPRYTEPPAPVGGTGGSVVTSGEPTLF